MGVFERDELPNGVRILTARMPHSQSAAVFLGVGAGARCEAREDGVSGSAVDGGTGTGKAEEETRPTLLTWTSGVIVVVTSASAPFIGAGPEEMVVAVVAAVVCEDAGTCRRKVGAAVRET